MRALTALAWTISASLFSFLSPYVAHAGTTCPQGEKPGVLIKCVKTDGKFLEDYVARLLGPDGIGVYIVFIAVLMIVFSGLEYMMGANSDGQKKAKERIRGILLGVAFYAIVLVLLRLISPSL